jgi:hypothetical protein
MIFLTRFSTDEHRLLRVVLGVGSLRINVTRAFDDVMGDTNIATPFKPHIHTYKFAHVSQTLPSSIPRSLPHQRLVADITLFAYSPTRLLLRTGEDPHARHPPIASDSSIRKLQTSIFRDETHASYSRHFSAAIDDYWMRQLLGYLF